MYLELYSIKILWQNKPNILRILPFALFRNWTNKNILGFLYKYSGRYFFLNLINLGHIKRTWYESSISPQSSQILAIKFNFGLCHLPLSTMKLWDPNLNRAIAILINFSGIDKYSWIWLVGLSDLYSRLSLRLVIFSWLFCIKISFILWLKLNKNIFLLTLFVPGGRFGPP